MKQFLLPEEGQFYKANLHCHTNISDGVMSPEEVKATYQKLGYQVVCYTDHEVLIGHEDLCDDSFVALHGYEVAIKKFPGVHTANFQPVYHFNLIAEEQSKREMSMFNLTLDSWPGNARAWFDRAGAYDKATAVERHEYDVAFINRFIKTGRASGFLVNYNHPQWSLHDMSDYIGLEGLFGIEVINGGCLRLNDNTSLHFETMLRHGKDVMPVAGDDNHDADCGNSFTMIKARSLTYEALIDAMKKGHLYASEAPEFYEISLEDGLFCVRTSPAACISLVSQGRHVRYENDTDCAHLVFKPESCGDYFRFEIKDAAGKRAYSRAYRTADYVR